MPKTSKLPKLLLLKRCSHSINCWSIIYLPIIRNYCGGSKESVHQNLICILYGENNTIYPVVILIYSFMYYVIHRQWKVCITRWDTHGITLLKGLNLWSFHIFVYTFKHFLHAFTFTWFFYMLFLYNLIKQCGFMIV